MAEGAYNIIVDSRERTGKDGPSDLQSVVSSLQDVGFSNVAVMQLDAGDFMLPASFGLAGVARESAETGGFYSDYRSGHLNEELVKLLNAYDMAIFLLEGWPPPKDTIRDGQIVHRGYSTGIHYEEVSNYLQSRQEDGIRLRISPGAAYTPASLLSLAHWLLRTDHSDVRRRAPLVPGSQFRSQPTDFERAVYILQGFPGVGIRIAEAVVRRWGVPLQWRITLDQLLEVPLIGEGRARRIWEVLSVPGEEKAVLVKKRRKKG